VGDPVGGGAKGLGHALGGGELGGMALAILDRQGIGVEAFGAGNCQAGGGIKPAREQDEGAGAWGSHDLSGISENSNVDRRSTGHHSGPESAAGLVAPDDLVELDLHAHGQAVTENPGGQVGGP
jgi:hypothetical protein